MYPATQPDQVVFTYQLGREYAPDDPLGLETLSLTTAGKLSYKRQQRGQVWQQQTNAELQLLKNLKTALAKAKTVPASQIKIPPGASLVQICSGEQQACVDYYQGQKLPGYAQIIQIMDTYLHTFRTQSLSQSLRVASD
ncbi:MAG: hypothetical protein AAGF24_09970 [Cyanobacteria bacterium P01_H01_bin.121]